SEVSVQLLGGVDPDWRGRGVGRRVLDWQRTRAAQNVADLRAAAAADLPARIGSGVEEQVTSHTRLLERAGFTATRWFTELRRPLTGPYEVPPLDVDGLRVEPYIDAHAERLRVAHNEAFLDHWGSNPHDAESWRTNLLEDEAFRPQQSFVIVDRTASGEPVAAYVVNTEYEQDWAAQGFTAGYTEMLGVVRAWRGRGLARQLLARSARVFADAGHPYATLDVDAENPTGAVALYASLGYEAVHRSVYYSVTA
ncbi:MAG: GNAT family N-acetyltransferase, partial [Nocardioidaceae bacterium]